MHTLLTSGTFTILCNDLDDNLVLVTPQPLPQPLATINLLSLCMDLPFLDISYQRNYTMLAFYAWLLSFSMFSRFIRVVVCIALHSFSGLDNILLFVCTTFGLSMH